VTPLNDSPDESVVKDWASCTPALLFQVPFALELSKSVTMGGAAVPTTKPSVEAPVTYSPTPEHVPSNPQLTWEKDEWVLLPSVDIPVASVSDPQVPLVSLATTA
jgi:hypothetical protein